MTTHDERSDAAREAILSKVRAALGRADASSQGANADDIRAQAQDLLPADLDMIRPQFSEQSNLERFVEKVTSERLTATVECVAAMTDVTTAVTAYIENAGVEKEIALSPQPALQNLDWGEIQVRNVIAANEPVAVGMADFGIAETGTVVFTSRADSPTLFQYLPLHHVVIVAAETILRYMDDYWDVVRERGDVHPRNTNFITGTSGTADIEAKNVRGAHGPRFMHIIIVGADAPAR